MSPARIATLANVLSLSALNALANAHPDELDQPVAPLRIGSRTYDTDSTPVIMGVVNLSRDSTYRESIAVSTASAVRKGRVMAAQGAHFVDIGAECSDYKAARVGADEQIAALRKALRPFGAEAAGYYLEAADFRRARAALAASEKEGG